MRKAVFFKINSIFSYSQRLTYQNQCQHKPIINQLRNQHLTQFPLQQMVQYVRVREIRVLWIL